MFGIGFESQDPGMVGLARQMNQMHFWNQQVSLRIGKQENKQEPINSTC